MKEKERAKKKRRREKRKERALVTTIEPLSQGGVTGVSRAMHIQFS